LPLAVALAWAFAARTPNRWRTLRLPQGMLLVAVLLSPWLVRELLSGGSGAQQALIIDQIGWYLHRRPTLATLIGPVQNVFGILVPWVLVVPLAAIRVLWPASRDREEHDALLFLFLWLVVLVLFVGLSQQQRLRYYLPLVPPVSIFIGWWYERSAVGDRGSRLFPWWLGGSLAIAAITAAVITVTLRARLVPETQASLPSSLPEALLLTGSLALFLATVIYGVRQHRLRQTFALAWAASAIFVVTAYHGEVERRNRAFDYGQLRAELGQDFQGAPTVAATWGLHELPLSFYLAQPVVAVESEPELDALLSSRARSVAIITEAAMSHLKDRGHLTVLRKTRFAFRSIFVVNYRPSS
jgi:4-amino-4-deoxy-L-arabinose transferase-like glycosyltransferase